MAETPRVAVYIDFDNVVISRYNGLFGKGAWQRDEARKHSMSSASPDPIDVKLRQAEVDVGALLDYATSFGTVAFSRAYADWSQRANAGYRAALVDRAVDLVQLFAASGTKNGADIRLSIDAVDDLYRHRDITHVVLVAGDSDYVSLAQRCRALGRYFIGIGVAGASSRALTSVCDEFTEYSDLPEVSDTPVIATTADTPASAPETVTPAKATKQSPSKDDWHRSDQLLIRAMRIGLDKSDDGWQYGATVKNQMLRLNSAFKEKTLGFSSFGAYVESRTKLVETRRLPNGQLQVKLL